MEKITSDHQLDALAADIAAEIVEEIKEHGPDAAYDLAHEHADGSEHVIYYHKAHAICQNCNTDAGVTFLEDVVGSLGKDATYNSIATVIAYGELNSRILNALHMMGVIDD